MMAVVDIGSNSVRMLLASVSDEGVNPEIHFRRITRLAGGASLDKGLVPAAVERTLKALNEISILLADRHLEAVRVVATEAVRSAVNGRQVAELIKCRCGYQVDILSGEEEAKLSALGVLAGLNPRPEHGLIFDIGGGSTEFIVCSAGNARFSASYPVGVVRLVEAGDASFVMQDKLLLTLREDLRLSGCLEHVSAQNCELIGTAGTVTTLAAMQMEMLEYDWRRVNNFQLTCAELEALQERLAAISPSQREELPGIERGRGDLILPGLQMVLGIMKTFDKRTLRVSDFGLLEGAILALARGTHQPISMN